MSSPLISRLKSLGSEAGINDFATRTWPNGWISNAPMSVWPLTAAVEAVAALVVVQGGRVRAGVVRGARGVKLHRLGWTAVVVDRMSPGSEESVSPGTVQPCGDSTRLLEPDVMAPRHWSSPEVVSARIELVAPKAAPEADRCAGAVEPGLPCDGQVHARSAIRLASLTRVR